MSLFGGELSAPQFPDRSSTPSSPEPSSTSANALHPLDLDGDDEYVDDDELEESDEGPSRPNRYKAGIESWRASTIAERQIVASLEKVESEDLAAHLYNAHNLKRRAWKPEEQLRRINNYRPKYQWLKNPQERKFIGPYGETQTELVPRPRWAAWPVPPNLIPTKSTAVGRADSEEDTWYIGSAQDVGEVMREEVLALLLKQAKETWLAREFEPVSETVTQRHKNLAGSEAENEGRPRSVSVGSDVPMQDIQQNAKNATVAPESEVEGKFSNVRKKRPGPQPMPKPQPVKAVFLADDDEARRIMQPSIDSLLARVDNLALAIRRSRANHFGYGFDSNPSGSEFTSDAESARSASRGRSRSRSKSQPYKKTKAQRLSAKRTSAGNSNSESESDSDYASLGMRQSSRQKRTSSFSSSRHSNHEPKSERNLMDWSEVLGMASVIGWDQEAVARAAQRCAALFGEGMSFRTLDQGPAHEPIASPVRYEPSTIPSPDPDPTDMAPPKRPYFEPGTLYCPHEDCRRSARPYPIPFRVTYHVQTEHGYDPRTNDSDNEDRTVGGVHIDGFLRPISAKPGWLGNKRAKGGKKKDERKVLRSGRSV